MVVDCLFTLEHCTSLERLTVANIGGALANQYGNNQLPTPVFLSQGQVDRMPTTPWYIQALSTLPPSSKLESFTMILPWCPEDSGSEDTGIRGIPAVDWRRLNLVLESSRALGDLRVFCVSVGVAGLCVSEDQKEAVIGGARERLRGIRETTRLVVEFSSE